MSNEFESVEDILAAYPEAREFADLIAADSIEAYASVAEQLALKVRKTKQISQPPSTPRNPKPDGAKSVADSIKEKDWSSYLSSKWVDQQERANG